MNIQSIQEQYQLIAQLLESKRLGEALTQLDAFLQSGGNWQLSNKLEQIKLSYQYMLQYMKQGTTDPERHRLYQQLLTETWEIADQTRLTLLDEVSDHYYHSLRKNAKWYPKEYTLSLIHI